MGWKEEKLNTRPHSLTFISARLLALVHSSAANGAACRTDGTGGRSIFGQPRRARRGRCLSVMASGVGNSVVLAVCAMGQDGMRRRGPSWLTPGSLQRPPQILCTLLQCAFFPCRENRLRHPHAPFGTDNARQRHRHAELALNGLCLDLARMLCDETFLH
jgi:hypothetical protein